MKYKFYTTSEKAWDAMLASMKEARHSIYLEMYILLNDTFPTHNFFDVLTEKARAGVQVKIIIDSVGSYGLEGKEVARLRESGVEILFFNEWFRRIHRKILIVDEKTAFLGGVNIGKQYIQWLDLQIKITGKIVRSLLRTFSHSYHKCGGTDPKILSYDRDIKRNKTKLWLLEHWSTKDKQYLRTHYEERLKKASKSITIVTPYFIPQHWLLRELEKAASRGVQVNVILPEKTDIALITISNHVFVSALGSQGVHFYFTKDMIHAKALLIDDEEGMIGSQNIDALSFNFNIEAGVFFQRKDMIRDLKNILDTWISRATLFDPKTYKPRWYDILIGPIVRLLQPIL